MDFCFWQVSFLFFIFLTRLQARHVRATGLIDTFARNIKWKWSCKVKVENWKLESESWKVKAGKWKLESESWKVKVEKWKLESMKDCWSCMMNIDHCYERLLIIHDGMKWDRLMSQTNQKGKIGILYVACIFRFCPKFNLFFVETLQNWSKMNWGMRRGDEPEKGRIFSN